MGPDVNKQFATQPVHPSHPAGDQPSRLEQMQATIPVVHVPVMQPPSLRPFYALVPTPVNAAPAYHPAATPYQPQWPGYHQPQPGQYPFLAAPFAFLPVAGFPQPISGYVNMSLSGAHQQFHAGGYVPVSAGSALPVLPPRISINNAGGTRRRHSSMSNTGTGMRAVNTCKKCHKPYKNPFHVRDQTNKWICKHIEPETSG
mmetsp:Transcript_22983/g.63835  ORF Transcript_22983/g.63835 Transcript_22983/m.63835 type:complete len:201 (-) Transcript_22983:561-1163(-)|eukprot:CAMPEP_0117660700 /NCGR_PEP_ID=MMETSP0804-20121206/7104_1 /TAXON_ID=1074897 /ORGANISM="Tetraselmis astigmatica, Strain CCMP880" /LENGTH=200 /DNA_ID=CAMNT_0005467439 /DNA_START=1074 /DNA_END=1676 /DNA_ORIENTATION=+